jgi:alpha-beta hydrolase superfamily lysophospholipase
MMDLHYQSWNVQDPSAVFCLVHGLGGHTGRWEALADFFKVRGIASYALALRGFGDAPGLKGHIDSLDLYLSDIESLNSIIRKDHPQKKIFLIGESLGGLICFLSAARNGRLFDGVICLSPAFGNVMRIGVGTYISIFLSLFYNPRKQFILPLSLSACSRDSILVRGMDKDAREHRFATARLLIEIFIAQLRSRALAAKISMPVLFLLSGSDSIVSSESSKAVYRRLRSNDKTIRLYPDMFHALSIELGREAVFADISNWVNKRF